jgi:hypothetical protein
MVSNNLESLIKPQGRGTTSRSLLLVVAILLEVLAGLSFASNSGIVSGPFLLFILAIVIAYLVLREPSSIASDKKEIAFKGFRHKSVPLINIKEVHKKKAFWGGAKYFFRDDKGQNLYVVDGVLWGYKSLEDFVHELAIPIA